MDLAMILTGVGLIGVQWVALIAMYRWVSERMSVGDKAVRDEVKDLRRELEDHRQQGNIHQPAQDFQTKAVCSVQVQAIKDAIQSGLDNVTNQISLLRSEVKNSRNQ